MGLSVPEYELEVDDHEIYLYRGRPFTGVSYEDRAGVGRSEVTYQEGIQHGFAQDWYPNGVLKSESSYYQNSLHGRMSNYSENGTLVLDAGYEYDILIWRRVFDLLGSIVEEFRIDPGSWNYSLLERRRRELDWPAPV